MDYVGSPLFSYLKYLLVTTVHFEVVTRYVLSSIEGISTCVGVGVSGIAVIVIGVVLGHHHGLGTAVVA